MSETPEHDKLLQATCEAIVTTAAQAIDAVPAERTLTLSVPDGTAVGKQIVIDATERGGPHNICRLSVLKSELAPEGEVCRVEFEHDKQTKFGTTRIYSVQSVRKRAGELVLLENFLSNNPQEVREQDFRRIDSESYAKETVLKTLQDWTKYNAWQMQQQGKK